MSNPANTRLAAVYVLYDVIVGGRSLSPTLTEQLANISNPPDKGLTQEIVFGTLRHYRSLQLTLKPFLKKAIPDKNKPLEIVLCAALYQLLVMRLPSYAVINESVNATKSIDFDWATGFVNGVLRAMARDNNLTLKTDSNHDHPAWLAKQIRTTYPEQADTIFATNHHPARMMLRVRPQIQSRNDYLSLLQQHGIAAEPHTDNKDAIVLTNNTAITTLPYFAEGYITVQDANAQLAANVLGVKSGMRVLDACAAPGGKTAHIFDKAEHLHITAIDNAPSRVLTLNSTLARLNVNANVITANAQDTQSWYDNKPFDRILLDAPCSATGVIRKHPDILFHRRESDMAELNHIQSKLLDSCWTLLKSGGQLLYATCSMLPSENQTQIDAFLARTPDASLKPLGHNRALPTDLGMLQFLSNEHGDGFFYALLEKCHRKRT